MTVNANARRHHYLTYTTHLLPRRIPPVIPRSSKPTDSQNGMITAEHNCRAQDHLNMRLSSAPAPDWDSSLMESDFLVEGRWHGPLTERLVNTLLRMLDMAVWKGLKAAKDLIGTSWGGVGPLRKGERK